jgi:hypothetical protein
MEDQMPEVTWDETYRYFWNPSTDETFRVKDGAVEEFSGNAWESSTLVANDAEELPQIDTLKTLQTIVAAAVDEAAPPAAETLPEGAGRRFRIPIVIPEGIPSGDRRSFTQGALEFKEPPMPLMWQKTTAQGHDGAVTVGKITHIERLETGGLGNAEGVFDTHEDAVEAARQVKEKFLTGVSGDIDQFEAELSVDDDGSENIVINHGRLVAATLVAKPAFQEATIEFVTEEGEQEVILASAGPLHPTKDWFTDPGFTQPTRLQVTEDGRVFGHIATWGTSHLGNPAIKPPRSESNYAYFNRRPVRTSEGVDVFTGQLTLTGGHAALNMNAEKAMAHYDDTRSAVADVVAGEDEFGIWVAGAMRPDITDFQVRAFRASEPSGDWRQVNGKLELVAVCQVNTPGFPVQRPRTLVAAGEPLALVAAGTELYHPDRITVPGIIASLESRIAALEAEREAEKRNALLSRINQRLGR